MTAPADELVLAVPRDRALRGGAWRGLNAQDPSGLLSIVAAEGRFRPRAELERDPGWKQIIPYLLLRDGERVFLMRRTRRGGDPRLHDRWSIGIGGHVNPADVNVVRGLAREWHEELVADFVPELRPLGLLNDDTDPVGRVHLGIAYGADAAGRPVAVREVDKLEGRFVSLAEVEAVRPYLESWSALSLEFLAARVGSRAGRVR